MKASVLVGLSLLGAALSRPAFAQTTPGTTVAPGVPINSNNPTAPVLNSGTIVPGQPGATPPVVTPPGTVYTAPATNKKTSARKRTTKTSKTTRSAM